MSHFTTEVRYICESYAGLDESVGFDKIEEILERSYKKIFSFNFPIFDELYRPLLEKKILRYYYTREIGDETVGLWKLRLCNKLNEIMPYYNQLYKSELIEYNPLYDVDMTRDYNKKNNGENTGSNTNSNTRESEGENSDSNWNLFNDTPQGGLEDIEDMKYLTTATKDYGGGSYSNTTTNNGAGSYINNIAGIEDYLEHVRGINGGNLSKKIADYRKNFLNIDRDIIRDLSGLFFYLWN